MSHEIPVFSFPVDFAAVNLETLTYSEALSLVGVDNWYATSRNWWYQGLLRQLLELYPGFLGLSFLLETLALVKPELVGEKAANIKALMQAIKDDPEPFLRHHSTSATPSDPHAERAALLQNVEEAQVLRALDDDCRFAHGNFFSYLASQAAALEEASSRGMGLLHFQPQPDEPQELVCRVAE